MSPNVLNITTNTNITNIIASNSNVHSPKGDSNTTTAQPSDEDGADFFMRTTVINILSDDYKPWADVVMTAVMVAIYTVYFHRWFGSYLVRNYLSGLQVRQVPSAVSKCALVVKNMPSNFVANWKLKQVFDEIAARHSRGIRSQVAIC